VIFLPVADQGKQKDNQRWGRVAFGDYKLC